MPNFTKLALTHLKFYMVAFSKNEHAPYLVFINGGPGLNCGVLEYLIEFEDFFKALNCNILLYDQRGCGRSPYDGYSKIEHADNVSDLGEILKYLELSNIKICGLVGHS